jgi:hypothetical protein
VVERKDCTISLRLATESAPETSTIGPPPESARAHEAIEELRAAAAKITNVKRAAGILGGISGMVFFYTGMIDIAEHQIAMGASILVCASALLGIVICITRHTNKVRAHLVLQIRAMAASEEC